jgi:hypothetical protein
MLSGLEGILLFANIAKAAAVAATQVCLPFTNLKKTNGTCALTNFFQPQLVYA